MNTRRSSVWSDPALRITIRYLVIGVVWIAVTDLSVQWIFTDSIQKLLWFSTLKGWFFVVTTGGLLYLLVNHQHKRLQRLNHELELAVVERTHELEATNEEVLASNEELVAANEELSAANEELTLMNEQLETASKKIEEQAKLLLRQKDEQLNRVLDSSEDIIFSFDFKDPGHSFLTRSAERLYGEPLEKLLVQPAFWSKYVHPEDVEHLEQSQIALHNTGSVDFTLRLHMPSGIERWMRHQLRLIRGKDGEEIKLEGILTDITAIKQSEARLDQERKLLRSLIDNLPDYIYVKDKNLRHIINNRANIDLLGAESEVQTLGKTAVDYFGEEGQVYLDDDLQIMESRKPLINKEEWIVRADGSKRLLLTTKVPLYDQYNQPAGLVGISRDVTEYHEQEHRLNQYRENIEVIFSNTVEEILIVDSGGRVVLFNKAFEVFIESAVGLKPSVGSYLWETTVPERSAASRELFDRTLRGESFVMDARVQINGQQVVHELRYSPVWINGTVKYITITSVDVTEKRRQEDLLIRSEANLKSIFENTNVLFALIDADLILQEFNPAYFDVTFARTGKTVRQGDRFMEILPEDRRSFFLDALERVRAGEKMSYLNKTELTGKSQWFQVSIRPVYSEDQNFFGYCLAAADVTEVQETREQLQANEHRFRALVENSADSFFITDNQGRVTYTSPNIKTLLGYEPEEFINMRASDLLHPDDLVQARRDLAALETQEGLHIPGTWRFRHKDGAWRWLEGSSVNLRSVPGINGRISVYHDITERKANHEEILRLNSELSDFQNAIFRSSIVSRADRSGNISYVNENFVRISGYSEAELVGKNHRIINSGYHPKSFWINMWKTISSGNIWRENVRNRAKDGTYYWVDTFVMPFVDDKGEVKEYLSIRNDITSRISAELDLKEKEHLLAKSNEVAHIGYFTVDPRTLHGEWSDEVCRIYGLEPGTFDGKMETFVNFIHPNDREQVVQAIEGALRQKQSYDIDNRIILRDGTIKWVHHVAEISFDEHGSPAGIIGITQDITNRKITEEILKEYNHRFEMVSKATNDAIWDWDIVNDLEIWNHGLETIFGHKERTIFRPLIWWKEHIHPLDYPLVSHTIDKAFAEKSNLWSASYRYKCADGSYKYVLDRAYILYHNDEPIRMIGAMQDVTKQKEATEEIEKLSLVAAYTSNSVIITDPNDKIEWVNDAFTKLTGYSLVEVIGRKPGSFLQGAETSFDTVKRISDKLKKGEIIEEDIVNYSKAGRKYWLRINITPVFDRGGELRHFISVQSDISDQKEYEARITTIAQELASLIENANVPIFGVDRNGYINEWNKVAAMVSEYSKNEVYGRKWSDLMSSDVQELVDQNLVSVMQGQPVGRLELPFISKSGKDLVFLLSISPRRDINRNIIGAICVGQDLTELIRYREGLERMVEDRTRDLNAALLKEKELVEMKSKFVSIASHEFRTPLTTISIASGFVKKFKNKVTEDEIDRKLDTIGRQVDHMTYLLDDVLMIGRAEAGRINVVLKPLDLRTFITKIADEVNDGVNKSFTFTLNWDTDVTLLNTDEKLMRNIFINLLTNAVKFSEGKRKIEITVTSTRKVCTVQVRDFGIGIPPEDIPSLFESFFRGSNAGAIQGTGLGLSIVKKAVELLRGQIKVYSKVGEGTEFELKLPRADIE